MYCENFVMIVLTADAGGHFKNRATIPLAPCILYSSVFFKLMQRPKPPDAGTTEIIGTTVMNNRNDRNIRNDYNDQELCGNSEEQT